MILSEEFIPGKSRGKNEKLSMFNLINITSGWISMRVLLRSSERDWKWPPGAPRSLCLSDFPTKFASFASKKDTMRCSRCRAPAGTLWELRVPPAPIAPTGLGGLWGVRMVEELPPAEPLS